VEPLPIPNLGEAVEPLRIPNLGAPLHQPIPNPWLATPSILASHTDPPHRERSTRTQPLTKNPITHRGMRWSLTSTPPLHHPTQRIPNPRLATPSILASHTDPPQGQGQAGPKLKLIVGKRWNLTSTATPTPMKLKNEFSFGPSQAALLLLSTPH